MATTVSEAPKMGIEMMLERIMGAMEKQNQELTELRRECSDLRTSNRSMEIMLQNISVVITSPSREVTTHSFPFPDREIPGFYVVIPAGGAGTRLWPLSRENHPKFLLDVNLCGNSLLQSTWERLLPLAGPSRMTVVAGPAHSEGILGQLPNLDSSNLFTEPGPKDSMAAIGLAAAILLRRDPEAVIGSFAADHMISGEDAFLGAVTEAVEVAKEGYLVTIGIAPSHPATGFGYIRLGDRLGLKSAPHSRLVSSFKEKPDAHTAAKYLATGQYRWNAGMFVTKASLLMELLKEHCPALYEGLMNISAVWDDEAARKVALEEVWPTLEKIPIDNAVAEPAAAQGKVAVIPSTFGWDDVGDFSSLAEMLPAESNKPRVLGDQRLVVSEQTAGGIVVPVSGRLITCLGVDDIVIVDAPDALMVTTRARSQEVKSLVKKCREAGWKNLLPEEKGQHTMANEADASRTLQSHTNESSPEDPNSAPTLVEQDEHLVKSFAWSDGGSTTNNTRRSSPADLGELSNDDVWDFEESLAPFSSPTSEKNQLPDTLPLVSAEQNDQSCTPMKRVDFSETASTIYRSSSFVGAIEPKDIWNFDDSPSNSSPIPEKAKEIPMVSSDHLPADELYDLTPKKVTVPTPAVAKPNGSQPVANDDTKGSSSRNNVQPKGKKQRPKAKNPIRFDSLTQEILEEPIPKKKKRPAPVRLPIVNALKESAKASSSPAAGPQRPKPKRARPQKKKKPEIPPAPQNPPKPRGEDVTTFIDSPAQPVAESPLEYLPQLPNFGKGDNFKTSCIASSGDDFTAMQEPKQQHCRSPGAIDRQTHTLTDSGAVFAEHHGAKRRRLSRQFSVSEKGSPVVVNDAIIPENIQPVPVKPHPPMSGGPELSTAAQSSSFLRSTSSGKLTEQQHGNAFDEMNGKSSSQWLRRVSNKAPVPKLKPSIERNLHDEIMKSILAQTDAEQEPQAPEPKSASAASPSHVEAQIRKTVDQLIARLDRKKKEVFNVVDTYQKNGQDSVLHLKRQCLEDSGSLVQALHNDGGLFGQKLRATTEAIQAHGLARAKSALELDSAVQNRHQAYDRTRQSLRGLRDVIIREKNAAV
ncbi:hypothetical protein GGI42DRAFT_338155 [Trichoderma sp. SZMC 28013]